MNMKKKDLKPCAFCGLGIAHSNQILCLRVTVTRMAINVPAVQRQHALEQMMGGNAAIAQIMGPDEDLLVELDKPLTVLVCDLCSMDQRVFMLAELEHPKAASTTQ